MAAEEAAAFCCAAADERRRAALHSAIALIEGFSDGVAGNLMSWSTAQQADHLSLLATALRLLHDVIDLCLCSPTVIPDATNSGSGSSRKSSNNMRSVGVSFLGSHLSLLVQILLTLLQRLHWTATVHRRRRAAYRVAAVGHRARLRPHGDSALLGSATAGTWTTDQRSGGVGRCDRLIGSDGAVGAVPWSSRLSAPHTATIFPSPCVSAADGGLLSPTPTAAVVASRGALSVLSSSPISVPERCEHGTGSDLGGDGDLMATFTGGALQGPDLSHLELFEAPIDLVASLPRRSPLLREMSGGALGDDFGEPRASLLFAGGRSGGERHSGALDDDGNEDEDDAAARCVWGACLHKFEEKEEKTLPRTAVWEK